MIGRPKKNKDGINWGSRFTCNSGTNGEWMTVPERKIRFK